MSNDNDNDHIEISHNGGESGRQYIFSEIGLKFYLSNKSNDAKKS